MNSELLNILVLLIASIISFLEVFSLARNKRVVKSTNELLTIANIWILVYGFVTIIEVEGISLYLILVIIFILYIIFRYSFGTDYRIYSDNKKLLIELIETAIRDIEAVEPEMMNEGKNIIFTAGDYGKQIVLRETDATWSSKKVYYIRFKKWFPFGTKREVISFIEDSLEDAVDYSHGIKRIVLQAVGSLILVCVCLGFTAKMVMEPKHIDISIISEEVPQRLYVVEKDTYYTDKETFEKLHGILLDSMTIRRSVPLEMALARTDAILYYPQNKMTFYIRKGYTSYIFINDSVLGSKNAFYKMCWAIHRLYDKNEGTIYGIYIYDPSKDMILNNIIDNI